MSYRINEMFYSVQGEGVRAGTPNVFVRFSACNLKCNRAEHGFDCDTEFVSGLSWTEDELFEKVEDLGHGCKNIIWTGGEPLLQLDGTLVERFASAGYHQAIETNGTVAPKARVFENLNWVCVSPKTAEHTLVAWSDPVDEIKYVRRVDMGIPKPIVKARYKLISPAHLSDGSVTSEDLSWCIKLVEDNPEWRLSVQQHKQWRVR